MEWSLHRFRGAFLLEVQPSERPVWGTDREGWGQYPRGQTILQGFLTRLQVERSTGTKVTLSKKEQERVKPALGVSWIPL